MILTLTANPSLDRTVALGAPLARGAVQRATAVTTEPGGKGVNVARVVAQAGRPVLAVLPGRADDPLLAALTAAGVPFRAVPVDGPARVNITLTEPDGTTTKVNEPGPLLDPPAAARLADLLVAAVVPGCWVALSGSLPPGPPDDWYARLTARLAAAGARVALDTSGPALEAALAGPVLPDLVTPNGEELAGLLGRTDDLEQDAAAAADAAAELVARGVREVLVTLGAAGAVLVDATGRWAATPPPVRLRSTVGAGDSALAGLLLAATAGAGPQERLRAAVAAGAAAAALPGSTLPRPTDLRPDLVVVTPALSGALP